QTDVPLDAVGRDQARRAARLLAALRPNVITASDLARAADTARELSALTGLPVMLDKGLRETYAGTWQGLTDTEIREKFPEEFAAWKRDHSVRRGGGELEIEVADRVVPRSCARSKASPRAAPSSWSATAAPPASRSAACSACPPSTGAASAACRTAAGRSSARPPAAGACSNTTRAPSPSRSSATTPTRTRTRMVR